MHLERKERNKKMAIREKELSLVLQGMCCDKKANFFYSCGFFLVSAATIEAMKISLRPWRDLLSANL
jgi:hypothetical protein